MQDFDNVAAPENSDIASADHEFDQEMDEMLQPIHLGSESEAEVLLRRIEELEAENADAKDQVLRAMAEGQNVRRRMQQEMEMSRKFATEHLVREIIPVLDNFERTVTSINAGATLESIAMGVKMVEKQLLAALANQQVERVASIGNPFDPEIHEAIGTVEAEGTESGTVVEELESGYRLHGRTLRAARVRVAK
ncbi:MAG: nucleotide exchange factor GrpE [Armatimonadetes bacterium]|nr:nucleotide exchange factor GrpE [Armatimonadota bacterium]